MDNVNVMDLSQKKGHCEKHMHRYVMVQTSDGAMHDGFVEHVDNENVYLAVPYCPGEVDERAFLPYGGFGYGYPYFPRRRFFPIGLAQKFSLL